MEIDVDRIKWKDLKHQAKIAKEMSLLKNDANLYLKSIWRIINRLTIGELEFRYENDPRFRDQIDAIKDEDF